MLNTRRNSQFSIIRAETSLELNKLSQTGFCSPSYVSVTLAGMLFLSAHLCTVHCILLYKNLLLPFFSKNIEEFIFFKSLRIKFSLIFKKLLKEIQTKFSTNKKTSNIMTYEFHKFNYSNLNDVLFAKYCFVNTARLNI